MAAHTYLKIGGPARLYVTGDSPEKILDVLRLAHQLEIPWFILGGGSNVLVSDQGFEGVVIQPTSRAYSIEGERVTAEVGVFTGLLARAAASAGLEGFEWGIGVPGTIGGAIYGDAGCFGGEMRDAVESVDAYDVLRDQRVTYTNAECRFGYRDSRFKHEPHVLFSTTLRLRTGRKEVAMKKLEDIMAKRKDSQPQGAFSAGCLFKNVEYTDDYLIERLRRRVTVPDAMLQAHRIPAGWLIDQLGLKGMTIGKAQVSSVHGNFLVNLGGATAADVIALSSLVKMKVRDEYGLLLEDEVQLLGF